MFVTTSKEASVRRQAAPRSPSSSHPLLGLNIQSPIFQKKTSKAPSKTAKTLKKILAAPCLATTLPGRSRCYPRVRPRAHIPRPSKPPHPAIEGAVPSVIAAMHARGRGVARPRPPSAPHALAVAARSL
jgi:hypothetical protein